MKTQTKHSLMLMLCAFIWGTAFVAQSEAPAWGPIPSSQGAAGWLSSC